MHKYETIIYWSNEDNAFIAEVPELPGCRAHGDTQEAALARVGLKVRENLPASALSHGEHRQLELAMALAYRMSSSSTPGKSCW